MSRASGTKEVRDNRKLAADHACAPPLTPKVAPWMAALLQQDQLIKTIVSTYGSPAHLLVTSEFKRNVEDLLSPLKERNVDGGLFFARKANKLPWFVSAAKEQGIGVDTASLTEVVETLELGVPAEKVVVTAIGKDDALVTKSIEAGCLIVIDNADELALIDSVARRLNKQARVGLRFSGFEVKERTVYSRFGFPAEDADALLASLAGEAASSSGNQNNLLSLEVLHAHIDRYDVGERACAGRYLLRIADRAAHYGHKVRGIDLGGGILMRYLESESQWKEFNKVLVDSVRGDHPPITYLSDGLGFYNVDGEVRGNADLYPSWNPISKERFIAAILDDTANGIEGVSGKPLHKELTDRGLRLFFEPGRALLDNAGVTLARVAFRKKDTLGSLLVGLNMNRFNLRPFRAEFCVDPFLVSCGEETKLVSATGSGPVLSCPDNASASLSALPDAADGAFLVGCLCSESDTIFRRRLKLEQTPNAGDIMFFVNTAGYLAHHLEVSTHGNPLPRNVLLDAESFQVIAATD
jgi:Diaminopimelate decarboxylase